MSKPSQMKRTTSGPPSNLVQPSSLTIIPSAKAQQVSPVSPAPASVLTAPPNNVSRRSYAELRRSEEQMQLRNEHLRRQLEEMTLKVSILEDQLSDQFASHGDAVATVQETQHRITQIQLAHTQERQKWLQERMQLEENLLETRSQLLQCQKELDVAKKNSDRRVHALLREFEMRGVDAVTLAEVKKQGETGHRYIGVFPSHSHAFVKASAEDGDAHPVPTTISTTITTSTVDQGSGNNARAETAVFSGQLRDSEQLCDYLHRLRDTMQERQRDMKRLMARIGGRSEPPRDDAGMYLDLCAAQDGTGMGTTGTAVQRGEDMVQDVFQFAFRPRDIVEKMAQKPVMQTAVGNMSQCSPSSPSAKLAPSASAADVSPRARVTSPVDLSLPSLLSSTSVSTANTNTSANTAAVTTPARSRPASARDVHARAVAPATPTATALSHVSTATPTATPRARTSTAAAATSTPVATPRAVALAALTPRSLGPPVRLVTPAPPAKDASDAGYVSGTPATRAGSRAVGTPARTAGAANTSTVVNAKDTRACAGAGDEHSQTTAPVLVCAPADQHMASEDEEDDEDEEEWDAMEETAVLNVSLGAGDMLGGLAALTFHGHDSVPASYADLSASADAAVRDSSMLLDVNMYEDE